MSRDVRLVPAAVVAWLAAAVLCAVDGAEEWAAAASGALWTVTLTAAGLSVARRSGRLATVAIAALAGAVPASVVAAHGVPERGHGAAEASTAQPWWATWAEPLRESFRRLTDHLPGDGGILLTGLAIGDDSRVGPALSDAMKSTSLTHLTAVSGANCALVVGAIMVGGALLGVRRRSCIALALLALLAFVILVTPQPSVVRAAVMAAFALVGLAASRPMSGVPLLSLAVIGIIAVSPGASVEVGFVLSVLATAGLLVLARPIGALLARVMPRPLALAIAVPIAAAVAVQPVIALLQPRLPTYGVLANLLAAPAAPLATVAGLLACLIAPLAPPVALAFAWAGWLPSAWIAAIATTFSGFPGAQLPWPDGWVGVALYAAVTVVVGIAALARGGPRVVAGVALAALATAFIGSLIGGGIAGRSERPDDWTIAMCDVGQGDAAVVRSRVAADQEWVIALIDTGPRPAPLRECLADLGITRIDLLVLTHFDEDHVGGTDAVLGRVGLALVGPIDARGQERIIDPLLEAGARVVDARRGLSGTLGGLRWGVLWPQPPPSTPEPGNDASVVVRFTPVDDEGIDAVFLGDLGEESQSRLLGLGIGGATSLVKVSHHGSADQSPALYARLAASVALIGVGIDNDYGHPTGRLLELLDGLGATVGRTDMDGLLLAAARDDGVLLWRSRGAPPDP